MPNERSEHKSGEELLINACESVWQQLKEVYDGYGLNMAPTVIDEQIRKDLFPASIRLSKIFESIGQRLPGGDSSFKKRLKNTLPKNLNNLLSPDLHARIRALALRSPTYPQELQSLWETADGDDEYSIVDYIFSELSFDINNLGPDHFGTAAEFSLSENDNLIFVWEVDNSHNIQVAYGNDRITSGHYYFIDRITEEVACIVPDGLNPIIAEILTSNESHLRYVLAYELFEEQQEGYKALFSNARNYGEQMSTIDMREKVSINYNQRVFDLLTKQCSSPGDSITLQTNVITDSFDRVKLITTLIREPGDNPVFSFLDGDGIKIYVHKAQSKHSGILGLSYSYGHPDSWGYKPLEHEAFPFNVEVMSKEHFPILDQEYELPFSRQIIVQSIQEANRYVKQEEILHKLVSFSCGSDVLVSVSTK